MSSSRKGLPAAIERALRVAATPPRRPCPPSRLRPVCSGPAPLDTEIIEGEIQQVRAGYPSDDDMERVALALHEAERPLIYAGDGIWKSGAEAAVTRIAERFGAAVATGMNDLARRPHQAPAARRLLPARRRSAPTRPHPLHRLPARRRWYGLRLRRLWRKRQAHRHRRGRRESEEYARPRTSPSSPTNAARWRNSPRSFRVKRTPERYDDRPPVGARQLDLAQKRAPRRAGQARPGWPCPRPAPS